MNSFWSRLFELGVDATEHPSIQNKIKLCNQITLTLIVIACSYSLFSLIYYPQIVFVPLIAIFICLSVFALNSVKASYVGRAVISVTPVMVAAAYNAYITPAGEPPLPGLYLMELTFALTPFLLIDFREKNLLAGCSIICFLVVVTFDWSNAWLEIKIEQNVLKEGVFAGLSVMLSVLLAFTYICVVVIFNNRAEQKSISLLEEMDQRNEELKNSEQVLKDKMSQLETAARQEKERTWISEGLGELQAMLRTEMSLNSMGDCVIKYIVKYLGVIQGGFYVVKAGEGGEVAIELLSCYAYERKKFVEKQIAVGQGLVGQAYLEKDKIFLTEIPQDYLTITSGLGKANPSCIAIIPLMANEQVLGIFELASFKEIEDYKLIFLDKAAESVGAIISSVLINEKTSRLLAETQELAEKLASQEEELRQNMEEMVATSEEMQRNEKDLMKKNRELQEKLKVYAEAEKGAKKVE